MCNGFGSLDNVDKRVVVRESGVLCGTLLHIIRDHRHMVRSYFELGSTLLVFVELCFKLGQSLFVPFQSILDANSQIIDEFLVINPHFFCPLIVRPGNYILGIDDIPSLLSHLTLQCLDLRPNLLRQSNVGIF